MPLHPQEHPALVRLANFHRHRVPPAPPGDGPPRPARRLEVFGTGTDWVQLTWSALGPGPVEIRVGGHTVAVDTDGGPGAATVEGLDADTRHDVVVGGAGTKGRTRTLRARTLPTPPGEELLRLATVSDVHLGVHTTGFLHTIAEIPTPPVTHTVRCLRSALAELTAWGAEHLVVKGDLVDRSDAEHWAVAGEELGRLTFPVDVVPGNHERSKIGDVDPIAGARDVGLHLVDDVHVVDRDGVRIVLADTTRPGSDLGRIEHHGGRIVEAAASTHGPVLVAIHHQLMRFVVPTYLPPGILRPPSKRFLRALGEANPRTLVTSGHTHRHRHYRQGPVTVTEVGSTKDFPGTWAGYQVHEGGVVQTVRRIAEPSVIRWTDHTRRAAFGLWGHWSPGSLADRCFTRIW